MSVVIGIDPDAKAHGVAIYEHNDLKVLDRMTLIQIMNLIQEKFPKFTIGLEVHIEDVASQNYMYQKHRTKKTAVNESITRRIGMCQQAQIELERMLDYLNVKVVKHKPSKAWKDANGKRQFEQVTGWTGRSNEDTRSAAYFGQLGL